MAVPKRRTSRSKRNKRRSHDALSVPQWISCPGCGEPTRPHRVCRNCGTYRGRSLVAVEGR
jgi:large subunit ribosomal protein L32